MAYVDANIFIFALTESSPERGRCLSVLDSMARGALDASTCSLTWDEVVYVAAKHGGAEAGRLAGQALLSIPNLRILSVDRAALFAAQELRERYGLSPRDSIHAACAVLAGEREFYSDDADFDKVKEFRRKFPK